MLVKEAGGSECARKSSRVKMEMDKDLEMKGTRPWEFGGEE